MRSRRASRPGLCLVLSALLALPTPGAAQAPPAAQTGTQSLRVLVLAGNGEVNDLERKVMAPVVVNVLDQDDRPVEGANVVFRFPVSGPSGVFPGPSSSVTVRTNADGQAAATGWTANNQTGPFRVQVTATRGSETGTAVVAMENVARVTADTRRQARKGLFSKRNKILMVVGAAAAGVGIWAATRGSNGGTITATPGAPTIGGPR